MAEERMELLPSSTTTNSNTLRRSNSVPLISGLGDKSQIFSTDSIRTRRNNTSFLNQHYLLLPPSPRRSLSSRLQQIKQEESMDLVSQEISYERDVQAAIQINRIWEENLNLSDNRVQTPPPWNHTDFSPSTSGEDWEEEIVCAPSTAFNQSALVPLKRKGGMMLEDPPKRVFQGTSDSFSFNPVQQPSQNANLSSDALDENCSSAGPSWQSPAQNSTLPSFPMPPPDYPFFQEDEFSNM